jgi:hypothetical protein
MVRVLIDVIISFGQTPLALSPPKSLDSPSPLG